MTSCASCRFFDHVVVQDDLDGPQPESICRRFPPVEGWSVVLGDDWCGEWTAPGTTEGET